MPVRSPKLALRRAQPWLGTLVEIGIADGEASAFAPAFTAIARVHEAMSPQRPESDLARFNAAPAGARIACDEWTLAVLAAARELGEASGGVFDATQGRGGPDGWQLAGGMCIKRHAQTRLDLGGIAKGEAVDRACAALQAGGAVAGWVNAGGDLRVFGELELPVLVRDAASPERVLPLASLQDGAIASSVFERSDYPTAGYRQLSIAAPLCRWADALTKCLALMPGDSAALLARYHARLVHAA